MERAVENFWTSQGFSRYHTGGGCQAFIKEFKDGLYMLVTDADGSATPLQLDERAMLGLYDSEGETIEVGEHESSRAAARVAQRVEKARSLSPLIESPPLAP